MAAGRKKKPIKGVDECLHDTRQVKSRGVCEPCGVYMRNLVRAGTITDEELVERGDLLPAKRAGRKAECGYAKKIAKAAK